MDVLLNTLYILSNVGLYKTFRTIQTVKVFFNSSGMNRLVEKNVLMLILHSVRNASLLRFNATFPIVNTTLSVINATLPVVNATLSVVNATLSVVNATGQDGITTYLS
jgi:hypothetical protein